MYDSKQLVQMYNHIIRKVSASLRPMGFLRAGQSCFLREERNIGVLNFQKSRDNRPGSLTFTVNIGVFCNRVSRILNGEEMDRPEIWDCHLRERLGRLLSTGNDRWWIVDDSTDTAALADELQMALASKAVPFMKQYLSDRSLLTLWQSGESPGLTDVERLKNLSALAKAVGDEQVFRKACQELLAISSGKPHSAATNAHIRKLGGMG